MYLSAGTCRVGICKPLLCSLAFSPRLFLYRLIFDSISFVYLYSSSLSTLPPHSSSQPSCGCFFSAFSLHSLLAGHFHQTVNLLVLHLLAFLQSIVVLQEDSDMMNREQTAKSVSFATRKEYRQFIYQQRRKSSY
jgi:hypothetical protein